MSIILTRLYSNTHHYDAGTVQIDIPFVGNTLAIELTTKPEYATTEQRVGTLFQFSGTAQKAYDLYSGKDIVKLELPETDKLWFSPTSYLSDNYVLTIDYTNIGSVINGSNAVSVPEQILGLPARVSALENTPVVSASSWDSVTGKPLLFTPSEHNHVISEVTGLTSALTAFDLSIQNIGLRLSIVELALIPPPPVLWTPLQLSPDLWFSSSDLSSLTLVSGKVSQWRDKSGNSRDLVQPVDGSRPVINGGVEFDGLDDNLTTSTPFTISTTANSFFLVEKNLNGAVGSAPFSFSSSSPNSGIVYQNNGGIQPFASSQPYNQTIGRMLLLTQGSSTGYANGNSVSIDVLGTGAYTSTDFSIGRRLVSNIPTSGIVYEAVAIPSTLSISDIDKLFGYAANLYGLKGRLRADHPYKTNPPVI